MRDGQEERKRDRRKRLINRAGTESESERQERVPRERESPEREKESVSPIEQGGPMNTSTFSSMYMRTAFPPAVLLVQAESIVTTLQKTKPWSSHCRKQNHGHHTAENKTMVTRLQKTNPWSQHCRKQNHGHQTAENKTMVTRLQKTKPWSPDCRKQNRYQAPTPSPEVARKFAFPCIYTNEIYGGEQYLSVLCLSVIKV